MGEVGKMRIDVEKLEKRLMIIKREVEKNLVKL